MDMTAISVRISLKVLAAALVLLVSAGSAGGEQTLIEDFEDVSKLSVSDGEPEAISAGAGVTQGARAVQLPPDASVVIKLSGRALSRAGWLRLDTMTVQPLAHRLQMEFRGPGLRYALDAYPQIGADTVALPAVLLGRRLNGRWPDEIELQLTNRSAAGLILDNLRVADPADAPAGSVSYDFGPDNQILWPGFRFGGPFNEYVIWSSDTSLHSESDDMPDPLAGDYIGPHSSSSGPHAFALKTPEETSTAAWVWVTHYGGRGAPAMEYALAADGKRKLMRRLSPREMLGPEGLLSGRGGQWTAEWFNETYVPQWMDVLELSLSAGRTRVDVQNCQVAAVVMGPVSKRTELTEYVETVRSELARYRRQFVVARPEVPTCEVAAPAGAEAAMLVFQPPADDAFTAHYAPGGEHLAETVRARTVSGTTCVIPLVVSPLADATFMSGQLRALRGPVGSMRGRAISVRLFDRVPRVDNGRVAFQPWAMTRRVGPVSARDVVHAAVIVEVSSSASAGEYSGELTFASPAGKTSVSVVLEVVDAPGRTRPPTMGLLDVPALGGIYGPLADGLPEGRVNSLTRQLRRQAFTGPFNAVNVPGAIVDHELDFSARRVREAIDGIPAGRMTGESVFSLRWLMHYLGRRGLPPGSSRRQQAIAVAISETRNAARSALPRATLFSVGAGRANQELAERAHDADDVAAGGGKPLLWTGAHTLAETRGEAFDRAFGKYAGLFLWPNSSATASQIRRFKALTGGTVMLSLNVPDRYNLGFYARGVGADGVYIGDIFGSLCPYRGFGFDGTGLLTVTPDGGFAQTLGMLRVAQAMADYELLARAEALLAAAGERKLDADKLDAAIAVIKAHALEQRGLGFDRETLRSPAVTHARLDEWRDGLIDAIETVSGRME